MLGIIAAVYGLVTVITGKFWLGKGKVATGNPARIAGGCLLAVFPVQFALGFAMGMAGLTSTAAVWGVSLATLIAGFVVAFQIAGKAAKAQAQAQNQFAAPEQTRAAA